MAVNLSNFSYALQTFYTDKLIFDTVGRDHPLLGMLLAKHRQRVSGDFISFPIQYSNGGGRSADFAKAQGNALGSKGVKLALTTNEDYAVVQWTSEVLESSEGADAAAFFDARRKEIDVKMAELANSLSISLYRSGSGSIGRISASQTDVTTLSLANPEDIKNLMVGMKIVGDSVDGGGTVGTTVSFVKSVDLAAGTFTVAATDGGSAISASTADLAANQYVFVYGDYDDKIKGLQAWIPSSVSGSDSFFGINRSTDRVRLAGWYLDKTGVPVEEAIIAAAKEVVRVSMADPRVCFINPEDWLTLTLSLATRIQYIDVQPNANATFAYRGVVLNGPRGPIQVIMDADCPAGEAFLCDMKTMSLMHKTDKVIHLLERDGLVIRAVGDADAWETRIKYNAQLACGAPGFNARIKLR